MQTLPLALQGLLMLFLGGITGVFSGLFGIGGGIILVPFLIFALGYSQVTATATSLVALLLPVGLLGVTTYYRAGKITPMNIKAGLLISIGLFFGAYVGARLALFLPTPLLRKSFATFLVLVAVRMWVT